MHRPLTVNAGLTAPRRPWLRPLCAMAALSTALWLPAVSEAALPTGSLSFVTPTADVGNTDVIDVFLRLELDADSAPLSFSSDPLSGFAAEDLPTQGRYYLPGGGSELRDFTSVSGAYLNYYAVCSGSFLGDSCAPGGAYRFDFWFGNEPGRTSLAGASSLDLAAGASTEFLLGSFTPQAGGAPAGTYSFFTAGLTISFLGQDAEGNFIFSDSIELANTGDGAFFRNVSAVPEPGSWALMLGGLLALSSVARRRLS